MPHEKALAIRDDVAFFQAVRAALAKRAPGEQRTEEELEHAIRQIVSSAIAPEGVADLFAAAGLKKPDISILSEEFLAEVRGMPQKNLAVELLRKLREGETRARELFRKSHRALRPEGRLVIIDMVPNDERTGPPFPLFFALQMLLHTLEGDTFTLAEYRRWLQDAGFRSVEPVEIGIHSPAIVATRS